MSLDISLIDEETGEEIISLNWLRNPFGLERWAESNVGEKLNVPGNKALWFVCNYWCYDGSDNIDRVRFKEVVDSYWAKVQEIEFGYFIFDLPEYRQFVEGKLKQGLDYSEGDFRYQKDNTEIAIRMTCFNDVKSLDEYKGWFQQLVQFAERLQDTNVEFECSN